MDEATSLGERTIATTEMRGGVLTSFDKIGNIKKQKDKAGLDPAPLGFGRQADTSGGLIDFASSNAVLLVAATTPSVFKAKGCRWAAFVLPSRRASISSVGDIPLCFRRTSDAPNAAY